MQENEEETVEQNEEETVEQNEEEPVEENEEITTEVAGAASDEEGEPTEPNEIVEPSGDENLEEKVPLPEEKDEGELTGEDRAELVVDETSLATEEQKQEEEEEPPPRQLTEEEIERDRLNKLRNYDPDLPWDICCCKAPGIGKPRLKSLQCTMCAPFIATCHCNKEKEKEKEEETKKKQAEEETEKKQPEEEQDDELEGDRIKTEDKRMYESKPVNQTIKSEDAKDANNSRRGTTTEEQKKKSIK